MGTHEILNYMPELNVLLMATCDFDFVITARVSLYLYMFEGLTR